MGRASVHYARDFSITRTNIPKLEKFSYTGGLREGKTCAGAVLLLEILTVAEAAKLEVF
jgi:hypothetical protein